METLRKTAAVLIFPALAWMGVACDGTLPTEPQPALGAPPGGSNWGSPSSTTRWVNDDATPAFPPGPGSSCSNPGYKKIQDAVDAAAPGDRIKVCPGTYEEQVKVRTGKDNIQLISVQRWKAVIKPPTPFLPDEDDVTTKSIVRVTASHNVSIVAFTISGPGTACMLNYGVRVSNDGSAKILGNHITKIRDQALGTCENGVAVIVGRPTAASAQILGNVIDEYQTNGPTVENVGSSAEISYNRIIGRGSNSFISQNGIQVSDGASATVRHNFIAKNMVPPEFGAGTGMIFLVSGKVISEHNTVTSNDYGVYALETPSGTSVTESRLRSSTYDGVFLAFPQGNQITHNASEHNALTGISLLADARNTSVVRNQVSDNDFGGVVLDDASNNIVRANHVHRNGNDSPDFTDGIRINSGTGNIIADNRLKRNKTHDCHDATAAPAGLGGGFTTTNTWTNNREGTSFPLGSNLCGDDEEDVGEDVNSFGWDANYPWYTSFEEAVDFDWAVGYAEFDLNSILALLPTLRIELVTRPKPSLHH